MEVGDMEPWSGMEKALPGEKQWKSGERVRVELN